MRIFLQLLILSQIILLPFTQAQDTLYKSQKKQVLNSLTRSGVLYPNNKNFDNLEDNLPIVFQNENYHSSTLNSFYEPLGPGFGWFLLNPLLQAILILNVYKLRNHKIIVTCKRNLCPIMK